MISAIWLMQVLKKRGGAVIMHTRVSALVMLTVMKEGDEVELGRTHACTLEMGQHRYMEGVVEGTMGRQGKSIMTFGARLGEAGMVHHKTMEGALHTSACEHQRPGLGGSRYTCQAHHPGRLHRWADGYAS